MLLKPHFVLTSLLTMLSLPLRAEDSQHLPTPYTAEQIRDAWTVGLTLKTRVTTPQGVAASVTTVTEWSEEGMTITDQPLNAEGKALGEATVVKATWAELRDHALFPSATASRKRAERETPIGQLAGWLYLLPCGENCLSEFFFADATPGSPVVYSKTQNGEVEYRAEIIERSPPPAKAPETGSTAEGSNAFVQLLDREAAALPEISLASEDGRFKTRVAAEVMSPPELYDGEYFLQLGIGGETPMECWIYPKGHDLAASHRLFSQNTFKTLEKVHGQLDAATIEKIHAGVFGGHPYIALDWLYRIKTGKDGLTGKDQLAAGQIKHLAAIQGASSAHCLHNETGYGKTFQRVFEGLITNLELTDAPTKPFYQEVTVLSLSDLPTGVAVTSMSHDANGTIKIVERTALLIPIDPQTVIANDSYNAQFSTADGALISELEIDSVNGQVTSNLRLEQNAEEGWKVAGNWSSEKLESTLGAKALTSILGQRLALRQFLVNAEAGSQTRFTDWTSDADPKTFTEIGVQVLGPGEDGLETRFDLGPTRKMDAVLDAEGSSVRAIIAMGSINMNLWRFHVEGALPPRLH